MNVYIPLCHNPHHSRQRPKPKKRERVCLTKILFSPLLSCFLSSPEGERPAKQRSLPAFVMVSQLSWHLMLKRVAVTTWQIHWPLPQQFKTCEPETRESQKAWWGICEVRRFNWKGGLVQVTTGSCHCCAASFLRADNGALPSQYTWGEVVGHQVVGCQGSSTGLVINETGRRATGSSAARATLVVTTNTPDTVWQWTLRTFIKSQSHNSAIVR